MNSFQNNEVKCFQFTVVLISSIINRKEVVKGLMMPFNPSTRNFVIA